jgi:hypothetical protein
MTKILILGSQRIERSEEFRSLRPDMPVSDLLQLHPSVNFCGNSQHDRFPGLSRSPHRKIQLMLPSLDRANALAHVLRYVFPRCQNECHLLAGPMALKDWNV